MSTSKKPSGNLAIQAIAMPADTNVNGDIFGGWLVSQMDLAAGVVARQRSKSRAVTVAIDSMVFHHPVQIGDVVCCFTELLKVGRTSMTIKVTSWIVRFEEEDYLRVTEGVFTYVAIDDSGKPHPVDR